MQFGSIGISYKEVGVEEREKLHLAADQYEVVCTSLMRKCDLSNLIIISTCNRVELYFLTSKIWPVAEVLEREFLQEMGEDCSSFKKKFICREEIHAIRHLCRVTAGLESMVVGEPQILGQVKHAFQMASSICSCGTEIMGIFQQAFSLAKKVRHETKISRLAVSVSYSAVELMKKIFPDLNNKTILVIGAGEMAENALRHFANLASFHLLVANRSFARAATLAEQYMGASIPLSGISKYLSNVDIVISSTGSQESLVSPAMVMKAMKERRYRPMFFIDIAVPRDIDPEINNISNAYVYDIDDLQNVVDANLEIRKKEARKAQNIIEDYLPYIENQRVMRTGSKSIKVFRNHIYELATRELTAPLLKELSLRPQSQEEIEAITQRFIHKLLHVPTVQIRRKIAEQDQVFLDVLTELFQLHKVSADEQEFTGKVIPFK